MMKTATFAAFGALLGAATTVGFGLSGHLQSGRPWLPQTPGEWAAYLFGMALPGAALGLVVGIVLARRRAPAATK